MTPTDPKPAIPDWREYALVIDARSPREYAEGHIPSAVNLPVVDNEQFAEVGIAYKSNPHEAYVVGAQYALRNIARHLPMLADRVGPDDKVLVYCARGGKRSRAWAEPLRGIGFHTDVFPGGWKGWRNHVLELLATLPARFAWRVVDGPTGSGKTRLLHVLDAAGEQVVDLEGLACHRGSLLGALVERPQPSQKSFDGLLAERLMQLDPARPVWIEAESRKVGELHLPEALVAAMRASPQVEVVVPLAQRIRLLKESYPHFVADPARLIELLQPLKALVGKEEVGQWAVLAQAGDVDGLMERLLRNHYDPSYKRASRRAFEHGHARVPAATVQVAAVDEAGLRDAARELVRAMQDLPAA